MVQSTHDGTFQNAIDRAKRCKMALTMAGKNKNVSNYDNSAQLETTQLTQMIMKLSTSVSEIKNEIKEKAENRSHYNGRNNNSQWNRNNNNSNSNNGSGIIRTRSPGHISRTCLQRNNNRSGNGGIAATVLNQQSQQPQLAQSTQPLNANSTNNLNSNNNDLIALLVQQLLAQKGGNSTTGGPPNVITDLVWSDN
ncbi:unnamed protein product [Rhizophagus irregularis]|nr:unnamed protein product [Rhizophagus irregularis]CAB5372464.1 unnamed protein product [Rhizophagus irregularis]CAB5395729.1 unnamed protein product [Rhizophagus irregularis]